jgi:hypothetical protein
LRIRFPFFINITLTVRRCFSGVNLLRAKAAANAQHFNRGIRASPCPQPLFPQMTGRRR